MNTVRMQIWIHGKDKIKSDIKVKNQLATGKTAYLFEEKKYLPNGSKRGYVINKESEEKLKYAINAEHPWVCEPTNYMAIFSPNSQKPQIWKFNAEKDEHGYAVFHLFPVSTEELLKE